MVRRFAGTASLQLHFQAAGSIGGACSVRAGVDGCEPAACDSLVIGPCLCTSIRLYSIRHFDSRISCGLCCCYCQKKRLWLWLWLAVRYCIVCAYPGFPDAAAGAAAGRTLKSRSRPLPTHPGMKYFRKETLAVDFTRSHQLTLRSLHSEGSLQHVKSLGASSWEGPDFDL